MNELLGALGLAWPRLLIYPGGVVALFAAWALNRCWRGTSEPDSRHPCAGGIGDLLPPLLVLSLLPVPPARSFPYGLDLPVALALAEWPRWRVLACNGGLAPEQVRRLLAPYGMLLLGASGMAAATASLELAALTRWPDESVRRLLFGCGALLWLTTLPALGATTPEAAWALRLRSLALLAVPVLGLIGALAALLEPVLSAAALAWLAPPLAFGIVVLSLVGFKRLPGRQVRGIWWIGASLLFGLLMLVTEGWQLFGAA